MSYAYSDSDSDSDKEHLQKTRERKEKDEYLLETVKLLNEGCLNAKEYASIEEEQNIEGVICYKWKISNIDYDFEACRGYCMYREAWDICPAEFTLCKSCKNIFDDRIIKPFTKSKSDLIYDNIILQKQIQVIIEKIVKIESILDDHESRIDSLESDVQNIECRKY